MMLYFRQSLVYEAFSILLAMGGLYWFAASFFLAKRSLPQVSTCHEAADLLQQQLGLSVSETLHAKNNGCWMDRRADSVIILLVDALRFDFAYYQLPLSIGQRLSKNKTSSSQLFQFLADPPTVTMQRIKALTTGSLPTFADISGSFGGADVTEDTWMRQLLLARHRVGFVGDDTWVDLFPADPYFARAYPYPSFNTRDLDTVDNGCLHHLPDLLQDTSLDVLVVHFLGVDHVGHTYGPHNAHMDAKLRDMDAALETVLETVDARNEGCHSVLIFGDHGMTQDGNHGGGTPEETNAALFVHNSPGCPPSVHSPAQLEQQAVSIWVQDTLFQAMHQIDLVPTLSILLGLPIPYSNLGGLVPSLLPGLDARSTAWALALNAAQVWRYFDVYSRTANQLPDLERLRDRLDLAVAAFQTALQGHDNDDAYFDCAALFKAFLTEALELGQRVWTRFDSAGMIAGFLLLLVATLCFGQPLWTQTEIPAAQQWERNVALLFAVFHCGLKSFSNSYIIGEESSIMYCMTILVLLVAFRIQSHFLRKWLVLIPIASRVSELFVNGHGMDPSIRAYSVHHPFFFLGSLAALGLLRWILYKKKIMPLLSHAVADCVTLVLLGLCWLEKRNPDPERNGYVLCQVVLALLFVGIPISIVQAAIKESVNSADVLTVLPKLLIGIMTATGPSTACSLVLYVFQISILLMTSTAAIPMDPLVVCMLLRLMTRHVFFATNHGCAFNRLQYSAAFVATNEFVYALGGMSLFLNTFGWEMAGLVMAGLMGRRVAKLYGVLQLIEALASCISVAVLRRHLMVWDIYAPHFLFTSIFTLLNMLSHLTVLSISS